MWPDRTTWIVGLGSTAALAGQSASPWVVNALTTSARFRVEQAGLVISAEMLAMGLVMMAVAPVVHRLPAKPVMIAALLTILVGNCFSATLSGFAATIGSRVVAGLGFGLLFALASALGARAAHPERTYAIAGVIALLIGTTINPALGYALEHHGHSGVFFGIALYCLLIGLPLVVMRFPDRDTSVEQTVTAAPVAPLLAIGVMAVMALLAVATNGIFIFLTTIAGGVGLAGTKLGAGMAVVSFVSAGGGVVAGRIGNRFGTLAPLAVGLSVMGATLFAVTMVTSAWQFWPIFTALVTGFWFLWPYIFGLAVKVDPAGRLSAATGSAKILAGGLGSGLAGFVVAWGGLSAFGIVALFLCSVALAISVAVVRRVDSDREFASRFVMAQK